MEPGSHSQAGLQQVTGQLATPSGLTRPQHCTPASLLDMHPTPAPSGTAMYQDSQVAPTHASFWKVKVREGRSV